MKKKTDNNKQIEEEGKNDFPGYPIYPAGQDVYSKFKEEKELDPEDISKRKSPNDMEAKNLNEKNFKDDVSGGDLDIPGSELDEEEENAGNEDEENNFYSLGGDDHNDLEEDNEH
ncbi:MAG TPA: hypothetical protein VK808_09540 [Bacteroidia bacterium]|jgi:hypothetical protein|nr:hypothetical protein [Bacteroidia bacterium]